MLLLYFLSVALISPPSDQSGVSIADLHDCDSWMVGGGISFAGCGKSMTRGSLLPWAILTFVAMRQLRWRLSSTMPINSAFACAAQFPFHRRGGLWRSCSITAPQADWFGPGCWSSQPYTVTSLFQHWSGTRFTRYSGLSGDDLRDFDVQCGAVLLYALAYALAALLIHRQFLGRRTPRLAGVFALLLPAAWALVPNIVLFFVNKLSWESVERNQLGNMFNVFIVKNSGAEGCPLRFAAILRAADAGAQRKVVPSPGQKLPAAGRAGQPERIGAEAPPVMPAAMS